MTDIESKYYSNRSNATRAAKAAKLTGFTLVKSGPGFAIQVAATAPAPRKAKAPKVTKPAKVPEGETKIAQLTRLCQRGATITELMKTLGWQAHTTRGAISRLGSEWGLAVTRTKVGSDDDGFESHYKIAS